MNEKLYVLLGDVYSSRSIPQSENFLNTLEMLCKKINEEYADAIFGDFKILKGIDEIGSVLSDIQHLYEIITKIQDTIYPQFMRFVVVYDIVDNPLDNQDVAKMSGPAFHKASDLMNKLKSSDLTFDAALINELRDRFLIDVMNLLFSLKRDWSSVKRQIFEEYIKTKNQYIVAKKLGISQQAVSKHLDHMKWKEIDKVEKRLKDLLKEYPAKKGVEIGC
jgi:hypothetical protein